MNMASGDYASVSAIMRNDDAFQAIQAIGKDNHVVLYVPTTPQTHDFLYQPLVDSFNSLGVNVFAMDYTPPHKNNRYLCFDTRHKRALEDASAAAVIVVIREDGRQTRLCQIDFAKKVWDEACADHEMPGVLVLIAGNKTSVGAWKSIVYCDGMQDYKLAEIARVITRN